MSARKGTWGDRATEVADELREKHIADLDNGRMVLGRDAQEIVTENRSLFDKLDFHWRAADKLILDQIQAAADAVFIEEFADVIDLIDEFYGRLRVPETNEHGVVVRDARNRMVWRRGDNGRPLENWDNLTGQDIEQFIFGVSRLKMTYAVRVQELQTEALFARHIYEDAYNDAYSSVLDGTIKDREARASRSARQDKYFAFFRSTMWLGSNTFLSELNSLLRIAERAREWGVRTQRS